MKDVNALIEELRTLISTSEFSAAERFQTAVNRIAAFLADAFGGEKSEVAILWNRGESLSFLWPDFLAEAKELSIKSKLSIAATIFRSGRSFLDNRLMEREHMVEYEFVKESDGESRRIWKMMGAAITVEGERLGVVQISRKRCAYNEPGPDFTPAELDLLEKLTARLGPFLKAVIPF
ncbi:MAG: GAF domain-containing protein [Candidatus Aminicenantes bacterium]|nr:GAF domain-containing protein [Acidobacteriota bacterium]MCG2812099.1 GAF domain-containing protein [Candidatus Aminicenantes bacterium]